MELEVQFHLGLGGFDDLPKNQQARLLAFYKVQKDPEGKHTKAANRDGLKAIMAAQKAAKARRGKAAP